MISRTRTSSGLSPLVGFFRPTSHGGKAVANAPCGHLDSACTMVGLHGTGSGSRAGPPLVHAYSIEDRRAAPLCNNHEGWPHRDGGPHSGRFEDCAAAPVKGGSGDGWRLKQLGGSRRASTVAGRHMEMPDEVQGGGFGFGP